MSDRLDSIGMPPHTTDMIARQTTRYYGYRYYAAPTTGARGGRLRA
jgi:hypothetical protein